MADERDTSESGHVKGRVTIIATGSRGDIQPQVALGRALQRAGWAVTFATHRCFEPLVASAGLPLYPLAGDSQRFFSGAAGLAFRDNDRRADTVQRYLKPFMRIFLKQCLAASEGADAILYWPPTRVGPPLSEKLGVPCFGVATYPLPHCSTREFPNPFAEPVSPMLEAAMQSPLSREWAHLQTWRVEEQVWRGIFEEEVTTWRRDGLGLTGAPAVDESKVGDLVPHLLGYSAAVLPVPSDWPATLHVTGYWFHDLATDWQPPATLTTFLDAGPRPVVIGFGSMVAGTDRETTAIVRDAVRQSGVRAILMSGWGGLDPDDVHGEKDVLVIKDAPHDWLFPRSAAVVHHGGSGTTAAGLRAGVPTLVVPFGYDQFLWGRRLHALGLGPRPIPHTQLTVGGLVEALRQLVSDTRMAERAHAFGERIRGEDGLRAAVGIFEARMGAA